MLFNQINVVCSMNSELTTLKIICSLYAYELGILGLELGEQPGPCGVEFHGYQCTGVVKLCGLGV
jgi:hypothetical protein